MSNALVLGGGGPFGAYSAGVSSQLGRSLGVEYFPGIYMSSVGVYEGTFIASGQYDIIEATWRNHVHGQKLINLFRLWKPLKLHYLEEIFQDERSLLDVDAVFRSGVRLVYVLTKLSNGDATYWSPTRQNIFRAMTASSAVPGLHPPVELENELFNDGAFSDPLPIAKALEDGARFVVAVINQPKFEVYKSFRMLGNAYSVLTGSKVRFGENYARRMHETVKLLSDPRVMVIRPSSPLPLRSGIDTDKGRLNATVDLGIRDGKRAVEQLKRKS